ncbi:hypothetical protein JAO76_06975 [Pontibacter sp. BT310]|uniref:Uncharacterized protein n=1 Tax=Pontibacter populi TaxID=890055 RepID=A0ABS6X9W8_9BACT|nr:MULTISPECIES: hypothetical protein [Pontibacter]MBJ6117925.1 hypothetical protein [Pontibacter sp. BT310]MBR0570352.1 hypothetical protein [Microvirga sp. STS03]MBW3364778.1 hypothetical protein [Pontibacter populi]
MRKVRLSGAEYFIFIMVVIHSIVGIYSFNYNPTFFEAYTSEDGYIENMTAFSLLLISIFFVFAAARNKGFVRFALAVVALVFIFGSGEEISWGQRLFSYQTPVELKEVNTQGEFNLHNMKVEGVKLNKLIFSTGMYSAIFIYFLGLPLLYNYSSAFRNWKFALMPVPKLVWGMLYLFSFMLPLFISHGKAWELQEFTFAIFLLSSYFYQQNPKFDEIVARHKANYSLAG